MSEETPMPKYGKIPATIISENNDSNKITRRYLDSLVLEYRYINSCEPETEIKLFGEKFASPVLIGGMSARVPGMHPNGMLEFAKAAVAVNTVNFVGYVNWSQMEPLTASGARTARIIKLQADTDRVLADIAHDEACGAFAYALDIDHVFGPDGRNFKAKGPDYGDLAPRTTAQLREIISSSKLPCVIKGVLSVSDAAAAVEAGASAILVSHHKGEIPAAIPPAMVLPEIRAAVGGEIKILADCGVTSGIDAFRLLALGADAVCVARDLLPFYVKEGAEGIIGRLNAINDELRVCMARTGTRNAQSFDPSTVRMLPWGLR